MESTNLTRGLSFEKVLTRVLFCPRRCGLWRGAAADADSSGFSSRLWQVIKGGAMAYKCDSNQYAGISHAPSQETLSFSPACPCPCHIMAGTGTGREPPAAPAWGLGHTLQEAG